MKRNRFSEMIPPTPADFHGSVVDALNRMEAVERRRRASANTVRAVAAVAAMLVVVGLAVMLPKRPRPQDVVAAPNQTQMIVRPTEEPEQVSMEIGAWQVFDDGSLELEWTMTATDEETLLVCGNAKPVFESDVSEAGGNDFSLDDEGGALDYRQIGRDVLGDGNGTVMQCTGRSFWDEEGMPVAIAIHFDVYCPAVEPVEHSTLGTESFQNQPGWVMYGSGSKGSRFAMPFDWHDGTHQYQTCFGSKLVEDKLSDFRQAHYGQKAATPEEALKLLQQEGALRTALLEGYDFADHVKSFDFIVDLTARSGEGADVIVN